MATTEKRTSKVILDGTQPAKTIKDLSADIRVLGNHMKKLDKDSQAFKTAAVKMRELKGELGQANSEMRNTSTAWSRMWKSIKITAAGVLLGNLLTSFTQMVTQTIPELIRRNAELSDSYADIQKTTGLLNDEVKELDKNLSGINTRTGKKELRELAVEAGRLGIDGVDNITSFVQAADQIGVALGDDLGGDTAATLRVVGKLTEQFGVAEDAGVDFGDAMLKTGSAINELSASGSTQADYLINFSRRVSGVANSADVTIDSVLAMGATLDEAGQNVEVSATTINKVLTKMFTDTEVYADIAGVKLTDFKNLLNQDAMAALELFLIGLKGNNEGLTELASKLEDAELSGARATAVLAALADNTEKLAEKQEISNKALVEGTSLTDEFNVKNNNLAATVDKIGKKLASLWLNSTLRQGITWMVTAFGDLIGVNQELNLSLEDQQVELTELEIKISRLNVGNKERAKLIEQLKSIYPGYLDWLNAEESTNLEIANAISMVNEKLVENMILKEEENKINEHRKKISEERTKLLQLELEVDKQLAHYAVERGVQFDKEADRITQIRQAQEYMEKNPFRGFGSAGSFVGGEGHKSLAAQIQESTEALERLKKVGFDMELEKSRIMGILGITGPIQGPQAVPQSSDVGRGSTGGTIVNSSREEQEMTKVVNDYAAFKAHIDSLKAKSEEEELSRHEQDLARIDQKYDNELEKLTTFLEQKQITEEEWQLRADEINMLRDEEKQILLDEKRAKELKAKESFVEDLTELSTDGMDLEIKRANDKYDELIRLAEQYGIDIAQIEELRENELAAIRNSYRERNLANEIQYRQELAQVYNTFSDTLVGFMRGMGEEQGAWAEFSKGIAFFNLAINQAQAISNALVNSTSALDPANAVTGGLAGLAKFATISSAIISTVGAARSLVRGENVPRYRTGDFYSMGPLHNQGGSKIINGYNGQVEGELEGNEAILSRDTVASNYSLVNALVQQGKRGGGRIPQFDYGKMTEAAGEMGRSSSFSDTLNPYSGELLEAAMLLKQALGHIDARVVFNNGVVRDLRREMDRQQKQESRTYGN